MRAGRPNFAQLPTGVFAWKGESIEFLKSKANASVSNGWSVRSPDSRGLTRQLLSASARARTYLGAVVKLSAAGVAEIERLGKFRFERMLRRELSSTEDLAVLPRRWRFVDFMPMDGLGKRRVGDVVALLEQTV